MDMIKERNLDGNEMVEEGRRKERRTAKSCNLLNL